MWLVNHPGQLAQVAEETTYSRLTLEESVILVSATKVALVDASPIIIVWLRLAIEVIILGIAVALLGFLRITFHQWLQSNGHIISEASTTA